MKEQSPSTRDTQVKGLIGRSRLIEDLLRAGLEIAVPLRDRGIDLIAYKDFESFIARPIQVKAASARNFSIDQKYEKIDNLIIAFVWNAYDPNKTETYALTYRQAVAVGDKLGWTKTASWKMGKYSQNSPSQELIRLLKPYKMTPERWRKKITKRSRLKPN